MLEDDWDGMGQRLTASGTSRFEDVLVHEDELLPSPIGAAAATPRAAFLQLFLVAVMAGIARNVRPTRPRSSAAARGPSATPRASCRGPTR